MNESAFPQIVTEYDDNLHEHTNNVHSVGGMDLRDYFAAKAMPIAATFYDTSDDVCNESAKWCYAMADAMMKARGE